VEDLLAALRAAAEPTRLRLLALTARGAFCVTELCEILGQSQPRLSRHLKLMADAGILERIPEGANVWFALPAGAVGGLARDLAARLPTDDALLAADRREAARVVAERARVASETFRKQGADWDEMRALELPAQMVEDSLLAHLPSGGLGRLVDIGTGTGRLLELLAPRIDSGIGIDASKAMLALARARLAREGVGHCSVRQADMYRLPLTDASCDVAVMQMVLHYAEDPDGAIAEAARVLRPGGRLLVIDLLAHKRQDTVRRFAHRWPGFGRDAVEQMLAANGLRPGSMLTIKAALPVAIWPAERTAAVAAKKLAEMAV
jgi:ubiquinone/menaquinone biosynthesis C-methylase UbiE